VTGLRRCRNIQSLALILIYFFSIKLDWLPITGIGSSEAEAGGL